MHKPIEFRWAAKFGLSEGVPAASPSPTLNRAPQTEITIPVENVDATEQDGPKSKQKLICTTCAQPVELIVARFCWFNKLKFGGNIYCRDCQKAV
jgi:hypothetical protein